MRINWHCNTWRNSIEMKKNIMWELNGLYYMCCIGSLLHSSVKWTFLWIHYITVVTNSIRMSKKTSFKTILNKVRFSIFKASVEKMIWRVSILVFYQNDVRYFQMTRHFISCWTTILRHAKRSRKWANRIWKQLFDNYVEGFREIKLILRVLRFWVFETKFI